MGLWYSKDSGFELIAFLDVDHVGCLDTHKSTSVGIQFLGDKLVSWMKEVGLHCNVISKSRVRGIICKLCSSTDDEDAHEHVRRVLEIVDLFHFPGVTHDAVMLRVFPITLKGRALRWKKKNSSRSDQYLGSS
ncbi:hypothetical protein Tco_1369907 [Tanacetum coccineum]